MPNLKTHAEAVADIHPAASGAMDTAYAHAALSGASENLLAQTVWGEAHAMFRRLRAGAGENYVAFDRYWTVFRNAPGTALECARAALAYYQGLEAKGVADAALRAERHAIATAPAAAAQATLPARLAFANGPAAAPWWAVGTELAAMAASIAAGRPIIPASIYLGRPSVPLGDDENLTEALDALDARLAAVAATLAGLRADVARRAAA